MVLALVRKELRETLAFAVLALAFSLVHVGNLTGQGGPLLRILVGFMPGMNVTPPDVPFVQDNFTPMLFFIGGVLAIALGFRQSAWEPNQGTALYLLHLPLPRRTIVATKLVTGVSLLLVCALVPILIYATWASLPRTHAGPFEWTMTGDAFRVWLLLPLVYLGAFASGIRPARWFGSRLLPLASVAVPSMFFYLVGPWWVTILVGAVFVSVILWETETRDF